MTDDHTGIHVTQGMHFRLSDLSVGFDESGEPTFTGQPQVAMDLFPVWAQRAITHTSEALGAHGSFLEADEGSTDKSDWLLREMLSSMEAAVTCGFSLDGLYASISERVEIDQQTQDSWNENGTARDARLGVVLRRGFRFPNDQAQAIDGFLNVAHRWRGWVAHPPADFRDAVLHPDLGHGVEWRFVAFRYDNVVKLTRSLLDLFRALPDRVRTDNEALVRWAEGLKMKSDELEVEWIGWGLHSP